MDGLVKKKIELFSYIPSIFKTARLDCEDPLEGAVQFDDVLLATDDLRRVSPMRMYNTDMMVIGAMKRMNVDNWNMYVKVGNHSGKILHCKESRIGSSVLGSLT